MEKSRLVRKVNMLCPICGKTHEVEERTRQTVMLIKSDAVSYEETYFFCGSAAVDECEFENGALVNANLMNARNAYRKMHGLLTSDEIIAIRQLYGLSQVDLARLMGWGEATISRYESKAIQDDSYDSMLKLVRDDPLKALELLEVNKAAFDLEKYLSIKTKMKEQLSAYGKEYLSRQPLKSLYIDYMEPSVWNGNTVLDIPKIEAVISFFVDNVMNPFKTKMMKLLWYADALAYKESGKAMTGLVYVHEKLGALPQGHKELVNLDNLHVSEEFSPNYDTILRFNPAEGIDCSILSKDEMSVLTRVAKKFKKYSAADIIDYMHKERAYEETKQDDLISFELAKEIRPFRS